MVVRTNINSINANRNLGKNNNQVSKAIEKLASGYEINRAADDASGLAISEKMRSQITGLDQGTRNCLDGVCLVQVAEGALNEMHSMLNRMVELATKSANGTISNEVDRQAIQAEVDVLVDEIDRIAKATNYNGIPLLTGMTVDEIIGEIDIEGILNSAKTKSTFLNVSSGVSDTNSLETLSSTYYRSDSIDLADGSLSVPSDAKLPYVISMEVVAYNETTSTEDTGSVITTTTISLTVDKDASGNLSVIGSNGTDYVKKANYQTNYDKNNGLPGYDFIKQADDNYYVTTTEMRYIMEELLNALPLDLDAGGYAGLSNPSKD